MEKALNPLSTDPQVKVWITRKKRKKCKLFIIFTCTVNSKNCVSLENHMGQAFFSSGVVLLVVPRAKKMFLITRASWLCNLCGAGLPER